MTAYNCRMQHSTEQFW